MPIVVRWSRSVHRWIAYVLGALVILWVVTGVVMMFPPPPTIRAGSAQIDVATAVRSPSEALQAITETARPIRSVKLTDLGGRLVYDFIARGGAHILVDAASAQRVMLSDSLAVSLVRAVMVDSSASYSVRRITDHDQDYRFGVLPAFRVEVNDATRTIVHVAADGSITSTSSRSRLRAVMAALHEFQLPGNLIPGRPRKMLLLGASAFTIILAITGYILALPVRRRG